MSEASGISTRESTDSSDCSSNTGSNANLTVAEIAAKKAAARLYKQRVKKGGGCTAIFLPLSDMLKHKCKLISTIRPLMSNSKVILAHDQILDTQVAHKVGAKVSLTDVEKWRVLLETGFLKTLSHPNLIKLRNFHETENCYVFALEYMKDGDLFALVQETCALDPNQVRIIAAEMALGLRYLHARRVMHRDVQPDNVGIRFPTPTTDGDDSSENNELWAAQVTLINFCLSTHAKSRHLKTPCGALGLGYMAPEILFISLQEFEQREYPSAVDMWSFGCLLYILLTGSQPFELGIVPQSKLDAVVSYPPSIWSKVPSNAQQVVEACLNPNPTTRIAAAAFLDLEWFQESNDERDGESSDGASSDAISDDWSMSGSGRSNASSDTVEKRRAIQTKSKTQKVEVEIANKLMDTVESRMKSLVIDEARRKGKAPIGANQPTTSHSSKEKAKCLQQPIAIDAKHVQSTAALIAKYKNQSENETADLDRRNTVFVEQAPPFEGSSRSSNNSPSQSASNSENDNESELGTPKERGKFGGNAGDSGDSHVVVQATDDDRSNTDPEGISVNIVL
ncbi:kinase-like domain-containing protein [Chytriomyces cf. hyalinus JEL632]|nr:kinase-like domain-containing protein [Chytriomyces cf. hyalinus JEL632]